MSPNYQYAWIAFEYAISICSYGLTTYPFKVARPNILIGTPFILESLILLIFNVKPLWHMNYTKTKLYHDIILGAIRINVTWQLLINCCTVHVFKKSIDEFCFNRCFHESSLRYYKKSSALCFTPDLYVFMSFGLCKCTCIQQHVECIRVICKMNEW